LKRLLRIVSVSALNLCYIRREEADGANVTVITADESPKTRLAWLGKLRFLAKPFLKGRWISFLLLIALAAFRVSDPTPVSFFRLKMFDVFQMIEPRPTPETQVVVADIDEASLAAIGQWPWSRTTIADLVTKAMADGASLVGFDVMFAEPDRLSPDRYADSIAKIDPAVADQLRKLPSTDERFAAVLKEAHAVLGQSSGTSSDKPLPKDPGLGLIGSPDSKRFLLTYAGVIPNTPVLEAAAAGRGLFIMNPEDDNVVRRVPAVIRVHDKVFPSLAFEMLRVGLGQSTILVKTDDFGVIAVALQGPQGNIIIPTDNQGRLWPHYAKFRKDRYISAASILNGTADPKRLEGKMVILGASAAGLRDLRTTPVDREVPGVEVHAQLIESILNEALLTRPSWSDQAEMAALILMGLVMIVGLTFVGAKWTLAVFLVVVGAMFGFSWWEFSREQLLIDATAPAMTALAIYMVTTYMAFMQEEAQRRQIKSAFGFYLSPAMVDKLASNPDQLRLGGETKEMTILFSDVRGFTTISEMFDAAGLTAFMNRYLTPMTDIAQEHGAYIDKYIGDAIMAFWNAPLDDPDHARNACRTVLRMRAALDELNAELEAEAKANNTRFIKIGIGIGLNTGPCVVGNMGSNQKFNYSVLGDTVNLASRLEGQSKPYHTDNIIGESTYAAAPEYAALEVDLIKVKGKTEAVRIFTLVGNIDVAAEADFQKLKAEHDRLLSLYRSQQWDQAEAAIEICRALAEKYGVAPLYQTYEERIAEYRENSPGENWDGVYVATSK
jgi:adenylate cyclase